MNEEISNLTLEIMPQTVSDFHYILYKIIYTVTIISSYGGFFRQKYKFLFKALQNMDISLLEKLPDRLCVPQTFLSKLKFPFLTSYCNIQEFC